MSRNINIIIHTHTHSDTLRHSKKASLDGQSGVFLGRTDSEFQFEQIKATVEFCESSATLEKTDLTAVTGWIASVA